MTLSGAFAVAALVLASLGIYGVVSYTVSRRTREIGVRMALGAQVGNVVGLVLRQGMALAGIGLAAGAAGALVAVRGLEGLLYEVEPLDPPTLLGVVVGLALVAGLATAVPARRASRVDPVEALRDG